MSGAARAGAVVYAKEMPRLARFYSRVLRMRELHTDAEYVVLQSSDFQLVIHAIPADIASTFEITSPPEPREETAVKLFFTVPSIEGVRSVVSELGGIVHGKPWAGEDFIACNAVDPEGNVFQLREPASAG
jgi:predicted enzyme related to lactoylglutathione lyase